MLHSLLKLYFFILKVQDQIGGNMSPAAGNNECRRPASFRLFLLSYLCEQTWATSAQLLWQPACIYGNKSQRAARCISPMYSSVLQCINSVCMFQIFYFPIKLLKLRLVACSLGIRLWMLLKMDTGTYMVEVSHVVDWFSARKTTLNPNKCFILCQYDCFKWNGKIQIEKTG